MFNNIRDYLQTRRKSKLYRQWVQHNDLTTEDIPDELTPAGNRGQSYPSTDDSELSYESYDDFPQEGIYQSIRMPEVPRGHIVIPVRYVMLAGSAVLLLLVIVSVLSTVLIMRSC
jgi:hypothetical protein